MLSAQAETLFKEGKILRVEGREREDTGQLSSRLVGK